MKKIIRSLRSGQITIPSIYRKQLGVSDETAWQISLEEGELRLKPLFSTNTVAGSPWLKDLYTYFAPIRAAAEKKGYSEEEITADVDEAIAEVRSKNSIKR